MARPKASIDAEDVEKLAAIHCTVDEIASVLGVHKRTLERRFAAVIEAGRNRGKMSLRRKQYEMARDGNVALLIWLGKQLLDQRDKRDSFNDETYKTTNDEKTKRMFDLVERMLDDLQACRGNTSVPELPSSSP